MCRYNNTRRWKRTQRKNRRQIKIWYRKPRAKDAKSSYCETERELTDVRMRVRVRVCVCVCVCVCPHVVCIQHHRTERPPVRIPSTRGFLRGTMTGTSDPKDRCSLPPAGPSWSCSQKPACDRCPTNIKHSCTNIVGYL